MSPSSPKEKETKKGTESSGKKLAVILVRGLVGVRRSQRDTLLLMRLRRKNICVVLDDTPSLRGMIQNVKDFVTWGELQDDVFQELLEKRGEPHNGRVHDSKQKYSYAVFDVGKK